jgi:DNA-binding transcriptional LysR family regulator
MRNLNLDQLKALLEVVELGSFSAAARRLNLTQPAVSLQVRELEGRMAVMLVKRVGKRAYATVAGAELIEHARGIFDSTDRAMAAMRRHKDGRIGRVHVGSGLAALSYILLPVLQKLRVDHPEIDLAITSGNTMEVTERMLRNAIDIGFVTLPVDERLFDVDVIRDMRMVAILPDSEADPPDGITPEHVAGRQLIVSTQRSNYSQLTRDWLRAAGLDLRPAMEIDNLEVIKKVVAAGLGIALVPAMAISHGDPVGGLTVRPLDPPLSTKLALVRRRSSPRDRATEIVREAILTLAEAPAKRPARSRRPV